MKHVSPDELVKVGSRQWIFNKIVAYYAAHPYRCGDKNGSCYYRKGNDMCWGGVLIGDYYRPAMEFIPARLLRDAGFALPSWFVDNIIFINALQQVHDEEENWENGSMPLTLKMFAKDYGLEFPQHLLVPLPA